jgi:hypothetical protein
VPSGSGLIKYFTGAISLADRPLAERLRYAFDHLSSADPDVAQDAYQEFARTEYRDYRAMAKGLPADTLAAWLRDPKTPASRHGLYGLLLGQCGIQGHGDLLRALLDGSKEPASGLSGRCGLMAGYVILQPKEGWGYLCGALKGGGPDFFLRYEALRTVRFLWDERPDVIAKPQLVEGVALALADPELADFAVEDLRKWGRWELCDRVLELFDRESHSVNAIRRAILRFALQCPGARAAAFVREQRRRDADWVEGVADLLRLEAEATAPEKSR